MTVHEQASSSNPSDIRRLPAIELICFGLCVAHAVFLAASFIQGTWLIDDKGQLIPSDFANVWAAGRLVLDGYPEAVYDWTIHKAVEHAVIGYAFEGYYAWLYPPPFLVVAAALAMLPYAAAQATWSLLTLPAYVAAIRLIVGHRIGFLLAFAFPPVVSNFVVGQNGFLSAALLGGTLGFMERRPLIAGCLLGLLTYKPHLGILFPLVLVASGRWHVFWAAATMGILVNAASWFAFGTNTWIAFVDSLPVASQIFLSEGQADWHKLQSLYGIVRSSGGSDGLAWSLQVSLAGMIALVLCAIWRSRVSFDLKAAALATGGLLATPYLYIYDLVALAVPMAFLVRASLSTGLLSGELAGLAVASLLLLIFPFVKLPLGPAALLIVAVLIGRRMLPQLRPGGFTEHVFVRS